MPGWLAGWLSVPRNNHVTIATHDQERSISWDLPESNKIELVNGDCAVLFEQTERD